MGKGPKDNLDDDDTSYLLGLCVDACDGYGIWNPAWIRKVENKKVYIEYEGWTRSWNEWIPVKDHDNTTSSLSKRLAPLYTQTTVTKAWALHPKLHWWPALILLRRPVSGTNSPGIESLSQEERCFVEFFDGTTVKTRSRIWVPKSSVKSMPSNEPGSKVRNTSERKKFTQAMIWLSESSAPTLDFTFGNGTLLSYRSDDDEKSNNNKKDGGDYSKSDFIDASELKTLLPAYKVISSNSAEKKRKRVKVNKTTVPTDENELIHCVNNSSKKLKTNSSSSIMMMGDNKDDKDNAKPSSFRIHDWILDTIFTTGNNSTPGKKTNP